MMAEEGGLRVFTNGKAALVHTHTAHFQTSPARMPVRVGPSRKNDMMPERGDGANLNDKELLSRPNNSWVASRTGTKPVVSGKDAGLPKPAIDLIKEWVTQFRWSPHRPRFIRL